MSSVGVYYLIILALIVTGAALGGADRVTWFILPIGLIAVLFQRYLHQQPIRRLGFRLPRPSYLLEAVLLPLGITAAVILLGISTGWLEPWSLDAVPHPLDPERMGISPFALIGVIALAALMTTIVAFFTEELAFRGYLITRLRSEGEGRALLFSSILFGLWHLPPSLFFLHQGWTVRLVYFVDICLLAILLGSLFLRSGSILPCAVMHGVWNGLDYTLFGFGETAGVLQGSARVLFDMDEGLAGTVVLITAVALILLRHRSSRPYAARVPTTHGSS